MLLRTCTGFLLLSVLLPTGCSSTREPITLHGLTMGTTYAITYFDKSKAVRDLAKPIDSLLRAVNAAISNFDSLSTVSRFNSSRRGIPLTDPHFALTLRSAIDIAQKSGGAFDPTVLPLVNAWGFGPDKPAGHVDGALDSLRALVGYTMVQVRHDSVIKSHPLVQLDFGGIGQGYGVDVVAQFLYATGIRNFLVEIGGEGYAAGRNLRRRDDWKIGILDPKSNRDQQLLAAYVPLRNRAFTTTAHYFDYRDLGDDRYGHTIDPFTGLPARQDLVSVSVFATNCASADAWATAFMVMGKSTAIAALEQQRDLDAVLFTLVGDGISLYSTSRIRRSIFNQTLNDGY